MRRTLGAALLCIAIASPALAQDITPEDASSGKEVVVTATRVPTDVENIPAGVTVVDRATMQQRDYNTLVDALSAVPGLRVVQEGGPGGQTSVFIRGTNSDHVLVLLDGMPINDSSDPGGAFNFGVDTLGDIERIEIVRGPMAAVYGSSAIGGVINLITRRGTQPGFHFTGDLAGGYPAQVRGTANASGVEGPVDFSVTYESQSQRGYDSTPQREVIYTGTPQGYRDMVGTINLGYTPVPGTRFSLLLRARQAVYGFDNDNGGPNFDNANSTGHDSSLIGRVGVHSALFGGTYETGLFVGRVQENRGYRELLAPNDPNQATQFEGDNSYRTDVQWNNTVHLDDLVHVSFLSATDLTYGYEYIGDNVRSASTLSFFGSPSTTTTSAWMTTNAAYTGLQTTLWNRLTVTGQLRQDWVIGDSPLTWRLGTVLNVPEIDTHFKLSYGTAFRAPSLFDRFGVEPEYQANPNLKPEQARGWEAGFVSDIPAFGRPDFASFGATYYNEQVEQLINGIELPSFVFTYVNVDSAHLQGVETELTLRPASWLTLISSYSYTYALDVDTGQVLARRPQNAATFDATIRPLPKLTIAPELLYVGAFQDFLTENDGTFGPVGNSDQGLVANLTITYDVTPRMQLYTHGSNIFGSRFEPTNGYQIPGPSVWSGVRFKL
jgi:vitamin B12 transporter